MTTTQYELLPLTEALLCGDGGDGGGGAHCVTAPHRIDFTHE